MTPTVIKSISKQQSHHCPKRSRMPRYSTPASMLSNFFRIRARLLTLSVFLLSRLLSCVMSAEWPFLNTLNGVAFWLQQGWKDGSVFVLSSSSPQDLGRIDRDCSLKLQLILLPSESSSSWVCASGIRFQPAACTFSNAQRSFCVLSDSSMRARTAAMSLACESPSVSASEHSEKRQSLVNTLDFSLSNRLARRGRASAENTVIGLEEALSCLLVLHLQFMQRAHPEPVNESFDSSQELETTHSLQEHTRAAHSELDFTSSLGFTPSKDQQPLEHSLSVGFVGFRNGWGGKDIVINESKLKRAREFMADSQEQSVQKQKNPQQEEEEEEMMKMPCFKAVGSGAEVKVSQAAQEQASRLFREFQSTRKPTKMKKAAKFTTESMIKTYSLQSKIKPIPHQPLRDSFNWEEYQKEFRREVEQLRPQSKSKKRSTLARRKVNIASPVKDFVFVRLPSLQVSLEREIQLGDRLREESQHMLDRKYDHICGKCGGVQCVLCRVECPLTELTVLDVYGVLNERFSKQRVGYEQFLNHYSAVCFKLLRHQLYWPELANKQCHPSNILVEIHKRTILMEKTDPSFLRECLSGSIGRSLNVIVRDKCINNKLEVVYLLLSDGWQSVWAAIGEGNLLFKYLKDNSKVRVGTKLLLALWDLHPLSNILAFCPKAHNDGRCLQFFYNGSIILKANARLGRSKEEFYRPLSKCRAKGGLVPVIEGFVVRLFAGKQASKRGKVEQTTAVPHFAELLTPEGLTCLVRFLLPEDGSLVEYFRLYHCYRLYRLKIGEEQMLTFLMGQSQLRQVNEHKVSEKEGKYPPKIIHLLSTRLLNSWKQWEDGTFDLVCLSGKAKIGEKEWSIEIQGQTNNFSAVYQQFLVSKTGPASLKLTKQRYSSQLRKCPKIYEQLIAQY